MAFAAIAALVLGVGWYGFGSLHRAGEPAQATTASPRVPVGLTKAATADVPLYLDSLGTVQAYNSVAVRTRIDGQIEAVDFQEGRTVEKDSVLVTIDARPARAALDQAKAKQAQDEALLANSKADLERYTKLGTFASRQQLDTQTATVAQQTSQVAADQAAVSNAETQLSYATVRAPIRGVAGFRMVDVGNIVNAATQTGIVTITQIEPISVVYTAPQERLQTINAALAKGPVDVEVRTSDGQRKLADGRLEIVNNQVDTATGTIRVKATFANKDHALWPGLAVSVRTRLGTEPQVVTVPEDAVQHGPKGLFVFAVDGNGRARTQPVKVARSEDGVSVISSGLASGDTVVGSGQYRVDDGTLVQDASKDKPTQGSN